MRIQVAPAALSTPSTQCGPTWLCTAAASDGGADPEALGPRFFPTRNGMFSKLSRTATGN